MSTKPIILNVDDVPSQDVPRSPGATIKVLLGDNNEMPNFHTRIFTLEPGTVIPTHSHDTIEHEQVMLEGKMALTINNETTVVEPGNVMYIPAKAPHGYKNVGDTPVRFVCCIPANQKYTTDFTD